MDRIAIIERRRERLQYDAAASAAEHGARTLRIEGPTHPVRREYFTIAVHVAVAVRDVHRRPTRQRHRALAAANALAGHVHRDQRAGARRLHIDARSAQVHLVRDARGEEIHVVVRVPHEELAHRLQQVRVAPHVVHQVIRRARCGEHAHGAVLGQGRLTRVLQRFPRDFHEETVRRIHHGGIARIHPEEPRIELVHVI